MWLQNQENLLQSSGTQDHDVFKWLQGHLNLCPSGNHNKIMWFWTFHNLLLLYLIISIFFTHVFIYTFSYWSRDLISLSNCVFLSRKRSHLQFFIFNQAQEHWIVIKYCPSYQQNLFCLMSHFSSIMWLNWRGWRIGVWK